MSKHLTGPSPSKKIYYAKAPAIVEANRMRKRLKHLKHQPADKQTAALL